MSSTIVVDSQWLCEKLVELDLVKRELRILTKNIDLPDQIIEMKEAYERTIKSLEEDKANIMKQRDDLAELLDKEES